MESQAKVLADLIAAISSMNAKLDDLHPVVLEMNQCRPGVERAVDAVHAEVGDLRARVVDPTYPAVSVAGTDMPPLFLLSADAPSPSSKPVSAPKRSSAAAVTSCIDVCTCASPFDATCCVTEVPLQARSILDLDAYSMPMGVTVVEMLQEVVPESVPTSGILQGSLSSVIISNETLGVDPSACTSFITMAPTTCSMVFLHQDPVDALVLVASSPPTMTKSSASQPATSKFPVHRPVPWPCFMAVHEDETRPLPWPSFRIIYSRESLSDVVMKPYRRCTSDSFLVTTIGDGIEFQVPGYYGNLCTSTSCITIHDMCTPSELRCWNTVLLFLEYLGSASEYVLSVHTLHITLVWPSCPIFGFPLRVILRSLELKLLSHDSTLSLQTALLDNGNYEALSRGFVSRLFSTLDGHLLDLPCSASLSISWSCYQELNDYFSSCQPRESLLLNSIGKPENSYVQFACAILGNSYWSWYFGTGGQMEVMAPCLTGQLFLSNSLTIIILANFPAETKESKGILIYVSQLVASKILGMFRQFEHWQNYMLQALPSWRSYVLIERNAIVRKNSYFLLLPWVFEQEELSLRFQFQQSCILSDRYLGNQSITARLCSYYCIKYKLLADIWRSGFVSVSFGAAVHGFVLPVRKHCRNWQGAQIAIGQDALLFLIQYVILNSEDYWWLSTVVLTEIVSICSARFPLQMKLNCAVQTYLLLAHTVDPGDVLVYHVICVSGQPDTLCLASGTIYMPSSSKMVLSKEVYDPWDPGGHMPGAVKDGGLRASRMLRRGECHRPCRPTYRVVWAAARRELQAQGIGAEQDNRLYLKGNQGRTEGVEELEAGRRTLARAETTLSSSLNSISIVSQTLLLDPST